MDYQRGFSTKRRVILAQPIKGRVQIDQLCVEKAFHGPTMLQPLLLNPVNYYCGVTHPLNESRP